jgi:alcohol dehydrogenase class IV
MMLAATMAGVGFGSAGVHIPHACAYPIAGLRPTFRPPGYPDDHAFVPHGLSVIVTAPSAFRFTYEAAPERHDHVAALLGADEAGPDALPGVLLALMRDVQAPRGIAELGYGEADIPELVEGARKQRRLLVVAPREPHDDDLAAILRASLENW